MTYTILIVEDEYLVRQGLTKLVNVAAYDMEIIGQAENCLLYTSPSPRD
mgnify:CR=1 FL=1